MAKKKTEVQTKEPQRKEIKKKDYEVNLQAYNKESYALSRPGDKDNFVPGWYPFDNVLRALKMMYRTPQAVANDWLNREPDENGDFDPLAEDFIDFICSEGVWDSIKSFEIEDVFKLEKLEHRRFLFRFFGPDIVFNYINPTKIAEETITKTNHRWDADNKPYTEKIQDTYELFEKPLFEFFPELKERGRANDKMYIVRMTCTSTAKTHFIFVPREIGELKDPIAAIAWTLQVTVPEDNIDMIFRQGDIVMVKKKKEGVPDVPAYHLTRTQYEKFMHAET